LGYFEDAAQAARAYDQKLVELRGAAGGFASLTLGPMKHMQQVAIKGTSPLLAIACIRLVLLPVLILFYHILLGLVRNVRLDGRGMNSVSSYNSKFDELFEGVYDRLRVPSCMCLLSLALASSGGGTGQYMLLGC
jgi:hypothetical protein